MRKASTLGGGLVAAFVLLAPPARADDVGSEALAQALFAEGRELVAAERHAEACTKFSESLRLVAASGTLINLALCHEKTDRLVLAYAELGESLARAVREGRADREKLAREHLASVERRLPRIILDVAPESALDTLDVRLDGEAVRRAAWGTRIPVDRGRHLIEATATDHQAFRSEIVAAESSTTVVTVPRLAASGMLRSPPEKRQEESASSPTGRYVAFGLAGVGLIALAVGSGFALDAASSWSDAKDRCRGLVCDDPRDRELGAAAGRSADIATGAFVVSGVAAIAAAALLLALPARGGSR